MALSPEAPPAPENVPHLANTDLAQAFKDLAKGEKAASVMESQLSTLERKIDNLLASIDEQTPEAQTSSSPHPDGGEASQTGAGTKK